MTEYYLWFKAFHLVAVISWMAGLLYLPRIFVYHTEVDTGSEADKIFQIMERKLLKFIMNPAMIIAMIFGLVIAKIYGFRNLGAWFHLKMMLVLLLTILHAYMAKCRRFFAEGKNTHSAKFYRFFNEIPAVVMMLIVILVIVKPFE
jgi:putative membrane protein